MNEIEKRVVELVDKAAKSENSGEALRFSQAALNAAHAAQVLDAIEKNKK